MSSETSLENFNTFKFTHLSHIIVGDSFWEQQQEWITSQSVNYSVIYASSSSSPHVTEVSDEQYADAEEDSEKKDSLVITKSLDKRKDRAHDSLPLYNSVQMMSILNFYNSEIN